MVALMVIGTASVLLLSIFIYKKSEGQKAAFKKCLLAVASFLVLTIGLELTLFNCNFYLSSSYKEESLNNKLEKYKTEKGDYLILKGEDIILPDVNKEIKNIQIKITEKEDSSGEDSNPLRLPTRILFQDEANSNYFATPERVIYEKVSKSQFINIHSSGKCENLILQFDFDEPFTRIDEVNINCRRSFSFSFLRVALLLILLIFIYIFRPSSPLYKLKIKDYSGFKFNLTVGFIFLQCIAILLVGTMNPAFIGLDKNDDGKIIAAPLKMKNHNQYDELAQAILKGKVYIDNDDIPNEIKNLKNPYDPSERESLYDATGIKARWDVAYYNGHYYVYFGIVPLLLMYLPFRAIFKAPFPSAFGVMLFTMIFSIAMFKLLGYLAEKKFKNATVGHYLILSLITVNCCGAMFLAKRPDFYSVPIIVGMSFVTLGLYLWLRGKEKNKKLYYLLGSLFMALAVGSRPQMVLLSFLALPIFWSYFFKEKNIFKKDGILNLIILAIPYVAVASGLMYYNYIRFGSPIEFGSIYNLTTNDVTRRGFDMGRTGLGLFTYLFQAPSYKGTFPYIQSVTVGTNYVGKTIFEYCFGGIIASLPTLWFLAFLPKVKNSLKEKKLWSFTVTLLLIGFIMVIADTQAGGLLQRYVSDFGFIFFVAAVIIILSLVDLYKDDSRHFSLNSLIIASGFLSLNYAILLVFSVADVTIDIQNPTLFGNILHAVEFWL